MTGPSSVALGYAYFRGFQLAALTVPWVLQKMRRPGATEAERSLALMCGSRSVVLGLSVVALAFLGKSEALAWVLMGDAVLQLFDAGHALTQPKRALAILPAVLCGLDGLAGAALMG